ncbi:iron-dependent repressor [Halorubrum sp. Ib24]|uniref:metal-dependent transcriptional regulator n=1 Tax=unclassified Halorubrum TaxID=2642239 RepID=UPI000B97E842|nr:MULTISPECIES: metal-dependent transcriptional regulator [unclassified Halorubrum]OYR39137.1 iron-dependent repressor [Halorubrum sp. Hd13]OYR40513.1 iron-dependent repressor [Halorubrum sp. Ib24]OYR44048.1 iron-dependent repressor [Halorubrum sp. Eb13]OYR51456.1 iron-dependent repressor [Halorubrum sp. Ea8]OYR56138.1 iron-dependent repressor [Halorubrum sp. Ea1]
MSRAAQHLLAVYILGHQDDPPIPTNAVAETLDRSPATVTETFQRLEEDGLVEYEAYNGVTLTDAGRERAGELHETYVTISWFFRSLLELDDYEKEAMELAGLVSPTVAERLANTLPIETDAPSHSDGANSSAATDYESS